MERVEQSGQWLPPKGEAIAHQPCVSDFAIIPKLIPSFRKY
jgi:hypothetical protein